MTEVEAACNAVEVVNAIGGNVAALLVVLGIGYMLFRLIFDS